MKKIIKLIIIIIPIYSFSQMTIGENNSNNPSVLLNFENTNNKGLSIPTVSSLNNNSVPGTIVFDATIPTNARVKVKTNTSWFDYSNESGDATSITSIKPTTEDLPDSKFILGSNESAAEGVLVLESHNKTMVLPVVTSVSNIIDPTPGMMVYVDKNTCINYTDGCTDKFLAFYDGKNWSFWKNQNL